MAKLSGLRFPHSLWDRLTDPSLIETRELEASQEARLDRLRGEVLKHLEWLLNSRSTFGARVHASEVLRESVVAYGLPDISGLRPGDSRDRDQLERILVEVIQRFEPRLRDVQVEFNPESQDRSRSMLHYRVRARIQVKPIDKPILIDTLLEVGSKAFVVQGVAEP